MRAAAHPCAVRPLALALLLLAAAGPAAAATYTLDVLRSTLLLRVWKEGAASVFAHDHVIRATRFTGAVRYDPARPQAATVEVEAQTASLVADEPTFRHRFDLPVIDERSRREIQHTMESAQQLDVATYATIAFRSTAVAREPDGQLRVTGRLTVHGQTRDVVFPAQVDLVQGLLRGRATLRFKQSDYGITPYSFGSAVRNQDEVELHLELIGVPGPDAGR
jgi:polyisoprenoid-binding protein YceI